MRVVKSHFLPSQFKLPHVFTCLVAGTSGTGKTTFITKVLENNLMTFIPRKIIYLYPEELDDLPVDVS